MCFDKLEYHLFRILFCNYFIVPRIELPDDRTETYLRTIKNNISDDTQLVVCILPTNRKDRYDSIKKLCCLENPGKYQYISAATVSPGLSVKGVRSHTHVYSHTQRMPDV